ncbi:hypothetical protein CONPUDRAFT_154277 [Coniophora puteana RWD-64-598 SS2]|uniref:Uncharacterized protein n=1 Tax=Coniophora puteana (strain RWD-64-598) TaxID=741705 RepID=A0A5M3MMI7_CONPW|nr:uncharacterized protein CONPUDRAFT_154277 [Coniophora puteana RWD-64-598 SS2]EIW80230.1 hypothetical protein CONPUDRAFT_154277 [Coniophora puteana RWD-64-598 SS2]
MGGFPNSNQPQHLARCEVHSCSDSATSGDEFYDGKHAQSPYKRASIDSRTGRRRAKPHIKLQKAKKIDPNRGRCAITRRRTGVETLHFLPMDTGDKMLTQLEWAWGMGWRRLDVASPHNTFFVSAEWKKRFDDEQWLLLPDYDTIQTLAALAKRRTAAGRVKLNKWLRCQNVFNYYFVPRSSLIHEIITTESSHGTRTAHTYPFATLGPISSHVRPHFVMYDASHKAEKTCGWDSIDVKRALDAFYTLYGPPTDRTPFILAIRAVDSLLDTEWRWTKRQMPRTFRRLDRSSRRLQPLYFGFIDFASVSDSPLLECNPYPHVNSTLSISDLRLWSIQAQHDAKCSGWEPTVVNDDQVLDYRAEAGTGFSPPPPDAWRFWRPTWYRQKGVCRPVSSFTSNDWAAAEHHIYLPTTASKVFF